MQDRPEFTLASTMRCAAAPGKTRLFTVMPETGISHPQQKIHTLRDIFLQRRSCFWCRDRDWVRERWESHFQIPAPVDSILQFSWNRFPFFTLV